MHDAKSEIKVKLGAHDAYVTAILKRMNRDGLNSGNDAAIHLGYMDGIVRRQRYGRIVRGSLGSAYRPMGSGVLMWLPSAETGRQTTVIAASANKRAGICRHLRKPHDGAYY